MMAKKKKKATHGGARPGAGRPKVYQQASTPTSIQFEQATLDALDKRAEELGITRSAAVQEAIKAWLGEKT
jgi:hypothetical protein